MTARFVLAAAWFAALGTASCAAAGPPPACAPQANAGFQASVMARKPLVEGVMVCGIVAGRPYERGGEHGLHAYIPLRVQAPGGATYRTQVIPNEELVGRIAVREGDAVVAVGQFVYPNRRAGYEGLIHDTHHATRRGGVDGYVSVNGTVYR